MIQATIYKDYSFTIFGKMFLFVWKYKMKLPETWDEMTRRQAIMFIRTLFFPTFKDTDTDNYSWRFRNRYLKYMMRDEKNLFGRRYFTEADFFAFGELPIYTLMERTKKLFTESAAYPAVKKVLVEFTNFYLPEKNLQYSSFIEFAMAEEYYYHICKGDDIESNMNHLCATLCRQRKSHWWFVSRFRDHNGDQRIPYDSRATEIAADMMEKDLEADFKYYIFFFYKACRKQLIKDYPAIFVKESQGDTESKTTNYRFLGALHQVAQEGAFGKWEECAQENVHNVLHYINYNQDKLKEAQERMKKTA